MHQACGGWHDQVDCPICRCYFTPLPAALARESWPFPFTPNRALDSYLKEMIGKLASEGPASGSMAPKKGALDKHKQELSGGKNMKRESVEKSLSSPTEGAFAWKEGGTMRSEWLKRDRSV
jgi:hypothetical protein